MYTVEITGDKIDISVESNPIIVEIAQLGPQGIPGTNGGGSGSSDNFIRKPAGVALTGNKAVTLNSSGNFIYADKDDTRRVIGITTSSVINGGTAIVQPSGIMEEPSWTWTPGALIYLGANGALTQAVPTGKIVILGHAISATMMAIAIQSPIVLSN